MCMYCEPCGWTDVCVCGIECGTAFISFPGVTLDLVSTLKRRGQKRKNKREEKRKGNKDVKITQERKEIITKLLSLLQNYYECF